MYLFFPFPVVDGLITNSPTSAPRTTFYNTPDVLLLKIKSNTLQKSMGSSSSHVREDVWKPTPGIGPGQSQDKSTTRGQTAEMFPSPSLTKFKTNPSPASAAIHRGQSVKLEFSAAAVGTPSVAKHPENSNSPLGKNEVYFYFTYWSLHVVPGMALALLSTTTVQKYADLE